MINMVKFTLEKDTFPLVVPSYADCFYFIC